MEDFAGRGVTSLSGGQQQRIAVARSIVVKPALLLLDEPFSALDRKLRETMQIELRRLLRDLGITSIFVTHDQDEALVMSDRIAVMNEGRIEHLGKRGRDLWAPEEPVRARIRRPVHAAARNGRPCVGRHDRGRDRTRARSRARIVPDGSPVVVAVRPEAVMLGEGQESEFNNMRAVLSDVVYLGSKTQFLLQGGRPRAT